MLLKFVKDITKSGQDGISLICNSKGNEEIELTISRTAFSVVGIGNDSNEGIVNRMNVYLSNYFMQIDDDEKLKSIDITSAQIVIITDREKRTIYLGLK